MRVLVATGQWWPDHRGGSARVATETAAALAARGHEVVVIAPRSSGRPELTRNGGLTVHRVLRRSALPLTLTDVVETARHAARLCPPEVDVLVAHQSTAAAGLSLARLDAPLALVFHASALRELRFLRRRLPSGGRRLATYALAPALGALERFAARRAHTILLLSEFSRQLVECDHPGAAARTRLVSGGVAAAAFSPDGGPDAARHRLSLDPDRTVLLTVRRLEPRMGIEQLLRAFRLLLDEAAGELPRLVVVGTGPLGQALTRLAAELRLGEAVTFTGAVDDDTLRDWYRAADLFVLPTVAYEGFGMATIEALACGTPVVGTPVGATPELLRPLDPRLLAAGAGPPALASAIRAALALPREPLREACRAYGARFDWPVAIRSWEEALVAATEGVP